MASVQGVDSVAAVDSGPYTYYSGNILEDTDLAGATQIYIGQQNFWGRYFGANGGFGTTMNNEGSSEIQSECTSLTQTGVHRILPIHSPGNVGGSYCDGLAAGKVVCDGIVSAIQQSGGQIAQPGQIYIYLDVEAGNTLSPAYWSGWTSTVVNYPYNNTLPFYPACYCSPQGPNSNPCSIFCDPNNNTCFAIWSNEPENFNNCQGNPPSWGPNSCGTCQASSRNPLRTVLWQFTESGPGSVCPQLTVPCGVRSHCPYPQVDRDLSTPDPTFDPTYYMLYLP